MEAKHLSAEYKNCLLHAGRAHRYALTAPSEDLKTLFKDIEKQWRFLAAAVERESVTLALIEQSALRLPLDTASAAPVA